jgi:hypothetical protein
MPSKLTVEDLVVTRSFTQPTQQQQQQQPILIAPESQNVVGTISSMTARSNVYNFNWSSSGPWTTYYNYSVGAGASTDTVQAMAMLLGDGVATSGTTDRFYSGDMMGHHQRQLQFSNGNRVGHIKDLYYYNNNTSNGGHTFRILPVRNTTNNSITRSISWYLSNYWSSGYEGVAVARYEPNSALYSSTTAGTWTQLYSTTSGFSGSWSTGTVSVTIPANMTILLLLASTHAYQTTYRFNDVNAFYNLQSFFVPDDNSVICDMRMLSALAYARVQHGYTSEVTHLYYQAAARMYGDR